MADRDGLIGCAESAPNLNNEVIADDIGCLKEQAAAWQAVSLLLHELTPEWHDNATCGMDAALSAIRKLAEQSPQPAPHAMTDSQIIDLADDFKSVHRHGGVDYHEFDYMGFARALLAQPAAVEPAKLFAEEIEWLEYAIAHMQDDNEPEDQQCAKVLQKLIDRHDAAPSPAVSEPSRKAIDAQGATADAMECLRDVVSHHGDFVRACELERGVAQGSDDESYWSKQIDVLNRMKEQAERALASPLPATTLGKADERAAFIEWITKTYPTVYSLEDAEHYWRRNHVCALAWRARSAFAQQPVASNVQYGMQHIAYFDDGKFHWNSGIAPRNCELYAPWIQSTPAVHAGKGDV